MHRLIFKIAPMTAISKGKRSRAGAKTFGVRTSTWYNDLRDFNILKLDSIAATVSSTFSMHYAFLNSRHRQLVRGIHEKSRECDVVEGRLGTQYAPVIRPTPTAPVSHGCLRWRRRIRVRLQSAFGTTPSGSISSTIPLTASQGSPMI